MKKTTSPKVEKIAGKPAYFHDSSYVSEAKSSGRNSKMGVLSKLFLRVWFFREKKFVPKVGCCENILFKSRNAARGGILKL
jgi:hypothetical protein